MFGLEKADFHLKTSKLQPEKRLCKSAGGAWGVEEGAASGPRAGGSCRWGESCWRAWGCENVPLLSPWDGVRLGGRHPAQACSGAESPSCKLDLSSGAQRLGGRLVASWPCRWAT